MTSSEFRQEQERAKRTSNLFAWIAIGTAIFWIALVLSLVGCGTMAPIVPMDPASPPDAVTNAYIVNPIYEGTGEVAKLAPVPYVQPGIVVALGILSLVAIWKNRQLRKKAIEEQKKVIKP